MTEHQKPLVKNELQLIILDTISDFFANIEHSRLYGTKATKVLYEVESAMYEAIMKLTKGNQVKAAKILGVSRGTLRTKLKQYFNTTKLGGRYHAPIKLSFDCI